MRTLIRLTLLALVTEALLLWMRELGNLRAHVEGAIVLLVVASMFYLTSAYLVLPIRISSFPNCFLVLCAAFVFRITVWPIHPDFSDDVFRYRWEGEVQHFGGNPYQVRPSDPEWAGLQDETYRRMAGKDFKAGYGPLLELEEQAAYRVISRLVRKPFQQAFWFKAPGAFFDLASIAALMLLLRAQALPLERALIYAWCPLPMFEFWVSGHHDSIVIFFTLLAILAAVNKRWTWSFAWLSLGAAAKFWPLLLFPPFARAAGVRATLKSSWIALPIFALCAWPYWSNIVENARFMSGFLGGWRNNDSLFGLLLWATGDPYRAKYAAFAILALAVAIIAALRLALIQSTLAIIVVMLLVSANCNPWYLTWFIPLLCFVPSVPLLLWTALMPLTYIVLFEWFEEGVWNGSTPMRWYVYVPVFAWLIALSLFRLRPASTMETK